MNIYSPWLIAALAGSVVLLLVVLLYLFQRKNHAHRFIKQLVVKHSQAFEEDVVLPDGLDGFLFVDYLMLINGKILAMQVVEKRGYVFGAEKIDEWTCVENNRTEKFNNPLAYVRMFTQEVERCLDFDAVEAYVLFGKESLFVKGIPAGVLQKETFEEALEQIKCDDAEALERAQQAWQKLMVIIADSKKRSVAEQGRS